MPHSLPKPNPNLAAEKPLKSPRRPKLEIEDLKLNTPQRKFLSARRIFEEKSEEKLPSHPSMPTHISRHKESQVQVQESDRDKFVPCQAHTPPPT